MKFLLTKQSWPDVWCWWKHHGHLLLVWASVSDWRSPPSLTFSFSLSLSLSPHLPSLSLSLLVSLSGEVMWGTSYTPYLSRPVVLILPWLFGCQEEQAAQPRGVELWVGGCGETGHWGAWETQSCCYSWTGAEEGQGLRTQRHWPLEIREAEIHLALVWNHFWHVTRVVCTWPSNCMMGSEPVWVT